jgi:hypothetical protein
MVDLVIDDLYANFLGLPEYVQLQPARLVMANVSWLQTDISSPNFTPRIMDFEVEEFEGSAKLKITVTFDPFGSMNVECATIACRPS